MGSNELPQIEMMCRANEETSITVYDDEPLILSVVMINDAAETAAYYNIPLKNKIREIERKFKAEQMEEKEFKRAVEEIEQSMMKAKVYRIGGPLGWPQFIKFQALSEDTWREVDWPLKLLNYHPTTQVANIDASTSCYVEFGLDPQDPQRPKEGFQVKAVVEIGEDKFVESDVITINFLQEKMPEAEMRKEENLLTRGRYANERGMYEDAKKYVQKILKANPHHHSALILLGQIEENRKDFSAALLAYEKALEESYKQYPNRREPPRALLNMIRRIRAMMRE